MDNTSQLTVSDIALLKTIIDLACRRGAYGGDEVRTVGVMYEKLTNFLNTIEQSSSNSEPADKLQGE